MSLLFAAALAASTTTMPTCSWDRPGANPYMGSVVDAVDRYTDIPAPVRDALKRRMAERRYDDIAVIRRDEIVGRHRYGPDLRAMHFGTGRVCDTVTRTKWSPTAEERGLVYCESGHCLIIPTVCRNVSRVTRVAPERVAAAAATPPAAPVDDAAGAGPAAAADPRPVPGGGGAPTPDAASSVTFAQASQPPLSSVPAGAAPPPSPSPVGGGAPWPLDPTFPGTERGTIGLPPTPIQTPPVAPIPEPATSLLWLAGIGALAALAARRRRSDDDRRR